MAKVEMYSIEQCPFCVDAKALLDEKGVAYVDHDISDWPDEKLNAKMMELTGRKTVPQIWINGEHIGGCEDLQALDRTGELDRKLGLAPREP
ncbi:MAG: glutaredoxin 3 [Armatimonadota bacterium]